MHAVILAAGRGSRLGSATADKPKLFVTVGDRTVYEHQLSVLSRFCDEITVVLGHGFDDASERDLQEAVAVDGALDLDDADAPETRPLYLPDWDEVENAASLRIALERLADEGRADQDLLVICGDVLFSEETLRRVLDRFEESYRDAGYNAVGCIEGLQTEMTAVRYDDDGVITEYGAIEGHQEVGLFVLNAENVEAAADVLDRNRTDWFPVIFTEMPSKRVLVPRDERREINTPDHLATARREAPNWGEQ